MKIELEVNPGDLAKSINEIMNTLTPEQKIEVAKQTMEKWLREPYDFERLTKEREVIEKEQRNPSGFSSTKETEEQIRKGYRFQEEMRGFRSTKEKMIETITREVSETYKAEVKKAIESDPRIQAMKDEVVKIIRETFPKTVHEAMVLWMADSMEKMFQTTMGIRNSADAFERAQQQLYNRLGQVESQVMSRLG